MTSFKSIALFTALLAGVFALGNTEAVQGRNLQQYNPATGCTTYPGGETCSKYNPSTGTVTDTDNGQSTTYSAADVSEAEGVLEAIGRKLASSENKVIGRKMKGYNPATGCTTYPGGETCSKYNPSTGTVTDSSGGSSTTYTAGDAESAASEAASVLDSIGRKLLNSEDIAMLRQLKAYSGCTSGDWGETCVTDLGNGTSETCTKTPYSNNCSVYPNGD